MYLSVFEYYIRLFCSVTIIVTKTPFFREESTCKYQLQQMRKYFSYGEINITKEA